MSSNPFVVPPSTTTINPNINPNDPRLTDSYPLWTPPLPWAELTCDLDRRAWIESLVAHGLLPKATSAVTCQQFFRKILEYSTHWARVGKTTCHLATCRNCGTGRMRVHRLMSADPRRYAYVIHKVTRTIRLTIHYSSPAATLADYRARATAGRQKLSSLWRKLRRSCGDAGMIPSFEPDPNRRDIHFRIYYVGDDPRHHWLVKQWQRIVGLQAETESRSSWSCAGDAFRWTLDALLPMLMLSGPERADWEKAFEGYRFTSSLGSLRGTKLDEAMEAAPPGDDPAAPWGRCPCGCGGVIVKSDHHAPMTMSQLASTYDHLEFGPLRDYAAYRGTMTARGDLAYGNSAMMTTAATASPPS